MKRPAACSSCVSICTFCTSKASTLSTCSPEHPERVTHAFLLREYREISGTKVLPNLKLVSATKPGRETKGVGCESVGVPPIGGLVSAAGTEV